MFASSVHLTAESPIWPRRLALLPARNTGLLFPLRRPVGKSCRPKDEDYAKFQKRLKKTCGLDLLVLDDFLLHTLTDEREVKLLFEILEKRSEMKLSTFICSQRDPKSWSTMILNDEVSANAILKRATKHFTVLIRPKSAT